MFKYSMTCQWCKKPYKSANPYGYHNANICPVSKIMYKELSDEDVEAIKSNTYAWAVEEFGISQTTISKIKKEAGAPPRYKWNYLTKKDKQRIVRMKPENIARDYDISPRTAQTWKSKIRTGC